MVERPSKTFKRIKKLREEEFIPSGEPTKSYKRLYKKTKMSWPLGLLYMKRGDVLVVILIIYGAIIFVICTVCYLALKWFLGYFGVIS